MSRVAIVGAGLSGLVVARSLSEIAEVTVFEKGRGAGCRIATVTVPAAAPGIDTPEDYAAFVSRQRGR